MNNAILSVEFDDGIQKNVDFKPLAKKYNVFSPLVQSPSLFKKAKIDSGGLAVFWNDSLDYAACGLYDLKQT